MKENAHKIFINTLLLTAASLVMKGIGLIFQVYLADKIGAASLGIHSLIMSVYTLFVTLGSGGIRFAVTRLTAAALSEGVSVRKTINSAVIYTLFFGLTSGAGLFFAAPFTGERWIGTADAVPALKILSLSLPFISVSAVFGGYFTGVERVVRSVAVNICEQLSRIFVTVVLLGAFGGDIRGICASLGAASAAGEIVSCAALSILYAVDIRRFPKNQKGERFFSKIFGTAMPIAVSSYMRTGLNSLGHILIPRGLRSSGADFEKAFATYGTIHGMAFPVLLFPSALLTALAELIIPRMTAAQSQGNQRGINYMAARVIKIGLIFSACVGGIMFFFGEELGAAIYKSADVGRYLKIFAPLIPVMYCDMVTDGCLKGLGQHMRAMFINIAEATLNVILLYLLIPRYAILGYCVSVYVCESFNFILSFRRLLKVARVDIKPTDLLKIAAAVTAGAKLAAAAADGVILPILLTILMYIALLYAAGVIERNDVLWFKRAALGARN